MGGPVQQPPQQPPPQYAAPQPGYPVQPPKGLATAAMVLGIIGLLFSLLGCLWFLGTPLNILAIIFGAVASAKAKRQEAGGEGMAKAGLVCGIIGMIVIILWIFAIIFWIQNFPYSNWDSYDTW